MLILFDQSAPAPLRFHLKAHIVIEARERGWDRLVNGELLNRAEAAGFELFLTADKNLRYQQNLTDRKIAIVVLGNARWPVCGIMWKGLYQAWRLRPRAVMLRWTYRSRNERVYPEINPRSSWG
jgi:hypothetical protein